MAMITTRNTAILILTAGGVLSFGSPPVMAQTFGADYTTEWQTNFKYGFDWLNLLQLSVELPICEAIIFETSTISVAKTANGQIVDDLLTYSNIEAGNIPLTFARLGFGAKHKDAEWFVGINNVNENYFTSNLTSFFTNSSCGISPTISCNYDIANYPLASWCIHYRQKLGKFGLQTSLYPGQGYYRLLGHNNLFSLNIKRDGIFSISSIDYDRHDIYCTLGIALHYGIGIGDEDGEQIMAPTQAPEKRFAATPWLLSEFSLPHNLGLHVHASYSTVKHGCQGYGGLGLIYSGRHVQPGIALNYAAFSSTSELAVELTSRVPIYADKAYLQPALHIISTDKASPQCVGMVRVSIGI